MFRVSQIFFIILITLFSMQTQAMTIRDFGGFMTDAAITTNIRTAMLTNQSASNFKMNVSTENGIVSLDGTVDSDAQAAALIQMAQATSGVKDVNTSHLIIKQNNHSLADIAMVAKVKGLFIREKLLTQTNEPMSIHIEAKNATVYLTGVANSEEQAHKAFALAQSVIGVKKVDINVELPESES
jgi:hyperosmotically inducible periplasmic protein